MTTRRWAAGFILALLGHALVMAGLAQRGTAPAPHGTGTPVHVELASAYAAPTATTAQAEASASEPPEQKPPEQESQDQDPSEQEPPQPEPEPSVPQPRPAEPRVSNSPPAATPPPPATPSHSARRQTAARSATRPPTTAHRTATASQAPRTGEQAQPHMAGMRATWQGRVQAHLEKHKRYPHAARARREQGTARVRLALDRQGRVRTVEVLSSAGFPLLDREVRETLRRAQPLPQPPPELGGEILELVWQVEFVLR